MPAHTKLFGSLGFTDTTKVSSTQRNTTQKTDTKQTQVQNQTGSQTGVTSSLDAETQQFIKDLVASFADGGQEGLVKDLTATLATRAQNAGQAIQDQINPIIADARLKGEQELQALQTQLAQQSGGSIANTLVASATGVGRAQLESGLAAKQAELTLAGRDQTTQELTNALSSALEGQAKPAETITNLLNVLKGSNIQQSQQSQQDSSLTSILKSLVNTKENSSSNTNTKSTDFKLGIGK